jgi:DNA-binding response OmpR family regulator
LKTILLVDDEIRMLNLLELYLQPNGYTCLKANGGYEALNKMKNATIDLVILDLMMPEMNGWETCEKIRTFSNVPIIILTARSNKTDVIKGLNDGADDYITKPFDEGELLARINALFRRKDHQSKTSDNLNLIRDDFILDGQSYTLKYNGKSISLTLKEFMILDVLMKNPERVYTREQLLLLVWDMNSETEIRTVDSHIRNLRDKLKKAEFPIENHLKTIWGIGYQWKKQQ